MPVDPSKLDAFIEKADACMKRFDAIRARRDMRKDSDRRKMADARMGKSQKKLDAFEEAHHPRNAGGIFTVGEGDEPKEDTQIDPGSLSKRNIEAT